MKFVRIIDGDMTHFCLLSATGSLTKLDGERGSPQGFVDLYQKARALGQPLLAHAAELADRGPTLPWTLAEVDIAPNPDRPYLAVPYVPDEVWGAAFTYLRAGESADDPYAQERRAERPVVFFKATPSRYVGPNDAVGSRGDCQAMIPEPELGLVLATSGAIIGYTIVNDVSSRDLPRQNPLYVSYSKIFDRCVSFGPTVVPAEAVADARNLDVRCRVFREGQVVWDETGHTGRMLRTFEELIEATRAHNTLPDGALLASGTALSPPADMHIVQGDILEVEIPEIGRLRNPVVAV